MADVKKERKVKDFSKGMIYRIVCNITGDVYIGSSSQTCAKRLSQHVSCYKRWVKDNTRYTSSYIILARNDYKLILVESYPCKNSDELYAREQYWIDRTHCVNKKNSYTTPEQKKEYKKNWYEENSEYNKEYRTNNIEKMLEYEKNYRTDNAEKITKQRSEIITCVCGSEFQICVKARHNKSQKHINFTQA